MDMIQFSETYSEEIEAYSKDYTTSWDEAVERVAESYNGTLTITD